MLDKTYKVWEPGDEEALTPAVIYSIICDIREGNPDPDQARRLLEYFVKVTEGNIDKRITDGGLFTFIRDAIKQYLDNPKNGELERLLGLKLANKRPLNTHKQMRLAWAVLENLLQGKNRAKAIKSVSDNFHVNERSIGKAWDKHKHTALTFETAKRANESTDKKAKLNDKERIILKKYYGKFIKD
jgi:hypothetical protein